jgi:CelD/BcsL family acetyltransferase involved in cellulose biosynthesis
MKTTVLPATRLDPSHLAAWTSWLGGEGALDSPFFRPEFIQVVAAVRNGIKVALLEEAGAPVGFFPFQYGFFGIGTPVGGRFSDFHGVISRPGFVWRADELIRGCGLKVWDFNHLPTTQEAFRPFQVEVSDSPFMDLSGGFEGYLAERARVGSQLPKKIQRAIRMAEREAGPMRFVLHTADPQVFRTLLAWKSAQYQRTKVLTDMFSFPWAVQFLERILAHSGEAFAGLLSALYFGDRLVAAHLGMRTATALHYWIPSYDTEFGKHSPGLILLMEIARAAAESGVRRLDLGKGDDDYKARLKSGAIQLSEGAVVVNRLAGLLRQTWRRTRTLVRDSAILSAPARVAMRWLPALRGWLGRDT